MSLLVPFLTGYLKNEKAKAVTKRQAKAEENKYLKELQTYKAKLQIEQEFKDPPVETEFKIVTGEELGGGSKDNQFLVEYNLSTGQFINVSPYTPQKTVEKDDPDLSSFKKIFEDLTPDQREELSNQGINTPTQMASSPSIVANVLSTIIEVDTETSSGPDKDYLTFGSGEDYVFNYNKSTGDDKYLFEMKNLVQGYIANGLDENYFDSSADKLFAELGFLAGSHGKQIATTNAKNRSLSTDAVQLPKPSYQLLHNIIKDSPRLIKYFEDNNVINRLRDGSTAAYFKEYNKGSIVQNENTITAIGINDNGEALSTAEDLSQFKSLASTLGFSSPKQLVNEYENAITPNMEIFTLANNIVNTDGFLTRDKSMRMINKYGIDGVGKEVLDKIANMMVGSNLPVKQRIQALAIALNRQPPQATDTNAADYNNFYEQIALVNGGYDLRDAKDVKAFYKKLKDGTDVEDLIIAYKKSISDPNLKTGFASALDRIIVNLTGDDGQIDQLKDMFLRRGSYTNGNDFSIDVDDVTGELDLDASGVQFAEEYFNEAFENENTHKDYKYGERVALRIFLAYKMAKYFDPSGRVSDQDLKNQLDAFAGGATDTKNSINGMLDAALKRVGNTLDVQKELRPPKDISLLNQSTYRRMLAAATYFDVVKPTHKNKIKEKLGYQHNVKTHKVKAIPNLVYKGNPVYMVHDAMQDDYIPFAESGGLTVIRDMDRPGGYRYIPVKNFNIDEYMSSGQMSVESAEVSESLYYDEGSDATFRGQDFVGEGDLTRQSEENM